MKVTIFWRGCELPHGWSDMLGDHKNPCTCDDKRFQCRKPFHETFEVDDAEATPTSIVILRGDRGAVYHRDYFFGYEVEGAEWLEDARKSLWLQRNELNEAYRTLQAGKETQGPDAG